MRSFVLRRLMYTFIALIGSTLFVFALSRAQGDPRNLFISEGGYGVTKETWEELGRKLNLDKPLVAQYFIWLGQVVRGDLGVSVEGRVPVARMIGERLWPTASLGGVAWIIAILIGIPLGVLSATRRGTFADYVARSIALIGQASPPFWIGLVAILVFAVKFGWVPPGTRGDGFAIRNYILPAVILGLSPTAAYLRLTRSAMLNILDSEYIKLARAKGATARIVIWKHAFKNAMIPPLTVSTLVLASLVTGSVVIETVFSWPGMGRMTVQAVSTNDFPIITGAVLVFTALYLFLNFMTDILYAVIDPRIRFA